MRTWSWMMAAALAMGISSFALGQEKKTQPAPAEPEGMVKIFDGKTLTGWEGNPKLWSVKDGAIHGESTLENPCKSNTFIIWKGGTPGDFELRLSCRIDHGNAGVQYRSTHLVNHKDNAWVVSGYQAEVANNGQAAGFLYHEKGRASLCKVGEKVEVGEDGKPKVVGSVGDRATIAEGWKKSDWNDYVIICKGNHQMIFVNGVQTIDVVDNDPKGRAMSGIIALQMHAGPPMAVDYKDIRIKEYPAAK
jgi:hypothetical protein